MMTGQRLARRHDRLQYRALRQLAYEHQREAEHWAVGRAGEEFIAATLAAQLDDRYILLRNYTPPAPCQSGGDIDALLLGPHGVTVFEVKALRGEFRCEGAEWYWRSGRGGSWQEAIVNPSRQAMMNAQRIRETLRLHGIGDVRVRPIVAVASHEMRVELAPPLAVYIYFAHRRTAAISSVLGGAQETQSPLSAEALQRVYAILTAHRQSA